MARKSRYSLMLIPEDDDKGMGVTAFNGDQPICSETMINLVAEWADLESIDGELHPYLDGTLNVLSDLTYSILSVIERMEQDDHHRKVLHDVYSEAYEYVQRIVAVVNDE